MQSTCQLLAKFGKERPTFGRHLANSRENWFFLNILRNVSRTDCQFLRFLSGAVQDAKILKIKKNCTMSRYLQNRRRYSRERVLQSSFSPHTSFRERAFQGDINIFLHNPEFGINIQYKNN